MAYFTSAATWNYLTAPFVFTYPDVTAHEIEPWRENGSTWRRLAVTFRPGIANHNPDQVFYYDDEFMLRRMDYSPDVTGSPRVAHYTHNPRASTASSSRRCRLVHLHDDDASPTRVRADHARRRGRDRAPRLISGRCRIASSAPSGDAGAMLAALLTALVPVLRSAHAAPALCTADVIETTLTGAGHELNEGVNLVRCGDVTGDGATDVVFTVASGGTAGDTHFGVIQGGADGAGEVVLYKEGYGIGIARHSRRSFDVLQPYYRATDANCCPSSFRPTRYTWTGTRFKTKKLKTVKRAPARFYR